MDSGDFSVFSRRAVNERLALLPGFTTLVVLVLFLNGMQFLLVGILGEYIGQIFLEVKQRPVFVVERTVNVDPTGEPAGTST
jgi:hypothetical protein